MEYTHDDAVTLEEAKEFFGK